MSQNVEFEPWTIFSGTYPLTNLSANDDVVVSDPVPAGFKVVGTNFDIIFTTSGGTIAYEKVTASGRRVRFAANKTANDNGTGAVILGPGEKLAIVLTSTGSGVLDVTWDGEIRPVPRPIIPKEEFVIDEVGIAAGGGL